MKSRLIKIVDNVTDWLWYFYEAMLVALSCIIHGDDKWNERKGD